MHALMNIVVQGHVAYRSIDDVLSITSHSSNTTSPFRLQIEPVRRSAYSVTSTQLLGYCNNTLGLNRGPSQILIIKIVIMRHPNIFGRF